MNALLTIALGEGYAKILELTGPRLKAYADRIGAKFINHNIRRLYKTYPHYEKFIIGEMLQEYERIIFIDADVLISSNCPNLLEIVPCHQVGMYDEGLLANQEERSIHKEVMRQAYRGFLKRDLPESWDGRFYNSGVVVASAIHRPIFKAPEIECFDNYWDQSYLNTVIHDQKTDVFDIGYRFNRMYYVDPKVNEHRLKSHIVHYAGIQNLIPVIQKDLAVLEAMERAPHYFV